MASGASSAGESTRYTIPDGLESERELMLRKTLRLRESETDRVRALKIGQVTLPSPENSGKMMGREEYKQSECKVPYHTYEAWWGLYERIIDSKDDVEVGKQVRIHWDLYCGTGMSTKLLADKMKDEGIIVVGVDRSDVRLSKGGVKKKGGFPSPQSEDAPPVEDNVYVQSPNCVYLRSDIPSLMALLTHSIAHLSLSSKMITVGATVYYPNPYPKSRSWNSRFYGQGWFGDYKRIVGGKIEVRSNWRTLVVQSKAVWGLLGMELREVEGLIKEVEGKGGDAEDFYNDYEGAVEIVGKEEDRVTLFEKKYFDVGEKCYRVVLT